MKEFTIKNQEAGQKLDKYLGKILSQAPKSFVYKMLRKKNIVLNDKKADGHEVLQTADTIKIYFSDETFAKFADPAFSKKETAVSSGKKSSIVPEILYEDTDLLLLNKPVGMLSQKAVKTDYSANDFVIDYLLESGQLTNADLLTFKPSICNRLDRNTSGILIAGKTITGLQRMAELLKDRSMKKYYLCIVAGQISEKQYLKGYLYKDEKKNKVLIKKDPFQDADYIETSYEPLSVHGDTTLLLVHLITGRSHQIRAHLASIGHPILGDYKYGNKKRNDHLKAATGIASQLLHAYRLVMPDGQVFETAMPKQFQAAMTYAEKATKEGRDKSCISI